MHEISAYVPVRNNAITLPAVLRSIREQSIPVADLIVIDDGSDDSSSIVAKEFGARVFRFEQNRGRGAARAKAIEEARYEVILSVDGTNVLPPDFVARGLKWLGDARTAAVFGRMVQYVETTAVARWRGRHLFKQGQQFTAAGGANLATYGCILKRSKAIEVGNFDAELRQGEDADLGRRILSAGYDVIFDPEMHIVSISTNTLSGVLERYWRWTNHGHARVSAVAYLRQIWYALRVMMPQDLSAKDPAAALISLLWPHYGLMLDLRHVMQSSQSNRTSPHKPV